MKLTVHFAMNSAVVAQVLMHPNGDDDWIMIDEDTSPGTKDGDALDRANETWNDDPMMQWNSVGNQDWSLVAKNGTANFLGAPMECFLCQRTLQYPPTAVPCCGFAYCNDCIQQWAVESDTCPCCLDRPALHLPVASSNQARSVDMTWQLNLIAASQCDVPIMTRFLLSPPSSGGVQCDIHFHRGLFSLVMPDSDVVLCTATQFGHIDAQVTHTFCPFNTSTPIAHNIRTVNSTDFSLHTAESPTSELAIVQTTMSPILKSHNMLVVIGSHGDCLGACSTHLLTSRQLAGASFDCHASFELVALDTLDVVLSFGRDSGGQSWVVHFCSPCSPLQAFAVALGSLLVVFES
ncbi:hypothetical protein H257_00615 [Aphanomyces astaci]|uniref:RING-type domain-containing protein n=1 Tax=Aphanomyces astaci TaxID=112090 RepID=W4HD89_APHAT|nr:hypothetical protein H257_00615 [Aphanomyces astaci]ETV89274.1 hypothetical protein H257_00615 [Aphanomyces astaci]|eukprot:XP_009821674.1 hypothetical protein H257_00615 [Aphanomyces astaci]